MSKKKWIASDGKTELRPGMLVLVRYDNVSDWWAGVFSHCIDGYHVDGKYCCGNELYRECLPLAGNESLAGTDAPIPEPSQDAPQPDKPLEWGERVRMWNEGDKTVEEGLYAGSEADGHWVFRKVNCARGATFWQHCELA